MFKCSLVLTILLSSCLEVPGSKPCDELNSLIDKTYNFKPSKLTPAQIDVKSAELDVVWSKVKEKREVLVPCLRAAINKRPEDRFFRFDASNLLIELDDSDATKKLLIQIYAEVDLADINLRYWIPPIATYGYQGLDTSAAGDNWLRFPSSPYYLRPHTRPVNNEFGALVIYGSMDETFATPALAKIASQKDHPGKDIAVRLLSLQHTGQAFRELRRLLDRSELPEEGREAITNLLTSPKLLEKRMGKPKISRQEYLVAFRELDAGKPQKFMELARKVNDGEKDAVAVMKLDDVPLIRRVRRYFASSGTPDAPEWYRSFTDILLAVVWKTEIQKAKIGKISKPKN